VLRMDAQALQQWFVNWDLWYVPVPGGLRPWARNEQLVPQEMSVFHGPTVAGAWRTPSFCRTHRACGGCAALARSGPSLDPRGMRVLSERT
jgi:hypothetical protein